MSAVTGEMTAPWNETSSPTFLSNYKLENIYASDDSPTQMYHPSAEKYSGGNNSIAQLREW